MTDLADKTLVRSRYVQMIPLDNGVVLCLHTIQQVTLKLKPMVVALLDEFAAPRRVSEWIDGYCAAQGTPRETTLKYLGGLLETSVLYAGTHEDEEREYRATLSELFGRDPEASRLAALRRASQQFPRFAVTNDRDLESFAGSGRKLDVVLVGQCEVQIGMDTLRSMGREAGMELNLIPTFESAVEMLKVTPHDAVIVGALAARLGLWHRADGGADLLPERYLQAVRRLLERLRDLTEAPIILQNVPVPTATALGFADRGPDSVRERARRINRELAAAADELPDVYVLDIDAALSYEGKKRLLDDRLISFGHLGGLGWWTMLPPMELGGVHGIRPPLERLAELGVGDPLEYDRVVGAEEIALLSAIFGIGRRKCVVVDVDGTLWPGRLAETGSPFPESLDHTVLSYNAFYLGIHEALKFLKARGVLLAATSGGDEEHVRAAWTFAPKSPLERLMLPSDFMKVRVNGDGAAANVARLGEELEARPDETVFVSIDPEAREAVRRALPQVLVLDDNLFAIRGQLITHPSLQVVNLREEGREHGTMVKALFERERSRRAASDPQAFLASLEIKCTVRRHEAQDLDRAYDLVLRTNQFTTTERKFTRGDLAAMAASDGEDHLYTLWVEDRLTNYGLVGVCVTLGDTIELFLLACRVVGLGVENVFLRSILADLFASHPAVNGRLLETAKNLPARRLFDANGFTERQAGVWSITAEEARGLPALPPHYEVVQEDIRVPEATRRGASS